MRPHTNAANGPEELHGLFIDAGVTHAHSCLDHIDAATDEVPATGVHSARIVTPDFETYDAALLWFCEQTRIVNPGELPPPPTQFELL
jgi:hypothetical protein